jgi:hypothetical protein
MARVNSRRANTNEASAGTDQEVERTPDGIALWWWWVAATVAGWAVAGAFIGATIDERTNVWQYSFVPFTAVGQWLVLRRRFGRASLWLLATAGGSLVAALGYAVLLALPVSQLGPPTSGLREALSMLFDGVALGTAQWLVLRQTVHRAGQWIPAMTAPMALWGGLSWHRGTEPGELLEVMTAADRAGIAAASSALIGFTVAVLTAMVLVRVVNDPRED